MISQTERIRITAVPRRLLRLELVVQAELDHTPVVYRADNLPEFRGINVLVEGRKRGMIQHVERIDAEFQAVFLRDFGVLDQARVHIKCVRSGEGTAL